MAAIESTNNLAEIINNHINQGTEKADSTFSSACIYRVPVELHKGKESFYTPRLVAIGPLHCNDEHLRPMQDVKMCYTNHLIRRLTPVLPEGQKQREHRIKVLQDCVKELKNCTDKAKKFYAEAVTPVPYQEKGKEVTPVEDFNDLSDDSMLEMMLVDGCFILEVLYRYELKTRDQLEIRVEGQGGKHNGASISSDPSTPLLLASSKANTGYTVKRQGRDWLRMNPGESMKGLECGEDNSSSKKPFDPIFDRLLPLTTVKQDMLLLENQIPFFVLEILFEHIVKQIPHRPVNYSLTEYVSLCFGDIMFTKDLKSPETKNGYYDHILHKLHEDHRWKSPENEEHDQDKKEHPKSNIPMIPCASELEYAGVKFVPGTGDNLLKLDFTMPKGPFSVCQRARFEIPPLNIYDQTELFLRNFIAYEQCCPGVSHSSFTTYAYLMDMLVNSEKDIQVLEKAGVMRNYLGASQDATDLFNKLCKETIVDLKQESDFADLCDEVLVYSGSCWPKNLAHIERTYFASPWTFIAFCVGFITFVIAIVSFFLTFF